MEQLIDDYEENKPLIDILSITIERWESKVRTFSSFNRKVKNMDDGMAVFSVLMEQNNLCINDFPELGSKSLVSKIMNGERQLTLRHIKALCDRFKLSPNIFFN